MRYLDNKKSKREQFCCMHACDGKHINSFFGFQLSFNKTLHDESEVVYIYYAYVNFPVFEYWFLAILLLSGISLK